MFEVVLLITSVLIGSLLGYTFLKIKKLSKYLLIFSGAYFLAIAILEIFPTIYEDGNQEIGLYVLGGLLFQMLVESLSRGVEHGHVHLKKSELFPVSVLAGLFLHSFFEAMPVMQQETRHLLWAIFIHNIPIAMILYAAVYKMEKPGALKVLIIAIFAVSGPLGLIFGNSVLSQFHTQITAFVAGIFIHIATVILFESNEAHKFKAQKVLIVLLGFAVAYLTV